MFRGHDLYALFSKEIDKYQRQLVLRRDLNRVLIHSQIYAINMFLKQPLQKVFLRDVWIWLKRICVQCFKEWM